jgi:cytoskeleton protein RodZ
MLRAAREKQGLHIAALAAAIKVSPRKLDALENDRWSELPDATFTRALAQTVCRTLKIDARPVLDKLPAAPTLSLESHDAGLNAPFRDRPGREEPGLALGAVRPMVWAAAVLMAAAVVVYFMPSGLLGGFDPSSLIASQPAGTASVTPAAAPAVLAAPSAAASTLPAVTAGSVAASAPMPAGETVFSAPPAAEEAAAAGAAASAAAATPAAAAAAAPAAGLVQLRTSEASWVEVRDARGATLLSRTVMPGESVGLDGNLPIRLTIGNASATQLGFRGQPVDLSTRTRDNVARVELQ